ncbi:MAG: SDR family oxidoreductase [Bacteroidetes bacterium]|nr:SDR family oxidoreductase [Bacteroidota bacterium]
MDLTEAKVLVTGGSTGIGRETARMLIEAGAKVAICARSEGTLEATANEIGAVPIPADVSNESDVKRLVDATVQSLGGYNTLINNAGFGRFSSLLDLEVDEFLSVWQTNVLGAMLVARESARHFIPNGGGNIVNISSTAGSRGFPGGTAYVASKFALGGMTECWRSELRKHDIRVMQVNPSEVRTEFAANSGRDTPPPNPTKLHAEDIAHTICGMLAMHDRGFTTEATVWATNPK